jgi:hypothetical protein
MWIQFFVIYFQKNHWICDIKCQNFRTVRNVTPNRKPAVTISFLLHVCKWSAHVVTVYPVCPWMRTKDYWVGSVTSCGCVGGKTCNLGTPDDRSEISPSQRKCVTVYTRCLDCSLYSRWVIYIDIDRMRVIYTWWTSRTLKSPFNQTQPFLNFPATTGK